jgi:hypothetical protein
LGKMDIMDRTELLGRASALLSEAADLIDEATDATDLHSRGAELSERIRAISSSNKDASVLNLRRDMEYSSEEHPGWTRPFASVKNVDRKDI